MKPNLQSHFHFSSRIGWVLSLLLVVSFLTGCLKTSQQPPSTLPPVEIPKVPLPPVPSFQRTNGEIILGGVSSLQFQYKDIRFLVDPVFSGSGTTLGIYSQKLQGMTPEGQVMLKNSASLRVEEMPPLDFLFLTDTQPHHLDVPTLQSLRKNLKVITTPDGVAVMEQIGFTQVKGLSTGQRVLLKKNEDFLFVSAVQSRNPVSQNLVNGYLFEFDNGRNIFISGEILDLAAIREFVYNLRDDGKEIYILFSYGGGIKSSSGLLQSPDENGAAEIVGLVQPQFALFTQINSLNITNFKEDALHEALKNQIYSGEIYFPSPGEKIPF